MKWFKEVFLKSFDARFAEKESIWITEKQVLVCRKYMKESEYFSFLYIIADDYQYNLTIMKKGYGRLTRQDKMIAYH